MTSRSPRKTGRATGPVYYLSGDDEFLKERKIRSLVDDAVDPAFRDFNVDVRRGGDIDAEAMDSLLGTPPLMSDRRAVVIRDVGSLGKSARIILDRYLEKPAVDTILVLVATAANRPDSRSERGLIVNATRLNFPSPADKEVVGWIVRYLKENLAGTITDGAARLLHESVGNDLFALASELDKLSSQVAGGEIDAAAVTAATGIRSGETTGTLLDCMASRELDRALRLLPRLLTQPRVSGVTIVMALTTQMLALAWARAELDSGLPVSRLKGALFDLLKGSGSVYTGRPWGEAVTAWAEAASRWEAMEVEHALEALLVADTALKSSRLSSEEQVLSTLILSFCTAATAAAA